MVFDEEHKKKVGDQLVLSISNALKQGELELNELPILSSEVLNTLKNSKTLEDAILDLKNLSKNWPLIKNIITIIGGEQIENKAKEEAQKITESLK